MRQWMIGTIAALLVPGIAGAADVYGGAPYEAPVYAPVPPVPYVYSWVGAYVGGNFGYQWGSLSNSGASPSGVAGGFQGGYNWQIGQMVIGGETDIQLSNASDTFGYKFSNPWFGTIRGRVGYAINNILFYGTLGLAYGRGVVDVGSFNESNLHVGWAGGAGMEVGLAPNWTVRAEYLRIDLSSENYWLTGTSNGLTSNFLRFGVNYRF
jgi:outer membrane immunogenic protein